MKCRQLHDWHVTYAKAVEIQKFLLKKITLEKFSEKNLNLIAGVDVSFKEERSRACIYVMDYPTLRTVEYKIASCKTDFPYIPGLLTFREGPVIVKCLEKLATEPDLFLFDGQGIAHPRRLGIAAHMGILLNKPSIGCAKSLLCGKCEDELKSEKGSYAYLKDGDTKIGVVLRSRDGVKPIYVSPGYKITITDAVNIVLKTLTKYRLPEPLRMAHRFAAIPRPGRGVVRF